MNHSNRRLLASTFGHSSPSLVASLAIATAALLAGCGGGGSSAAAAAGVTSASGMSTLASVSLQTAGTICTAGGSKIEAGIDTNGNGTLDSSEVTSTQYVCTGMNGAAGADGATGATGATGTQGVAGAQSLVAMQAENAGANCATGGTKISVGQDANGDVVLDAAEISSVGYVCQGVTGSTGTTGASGAVSLISIVPESAGANCAAGGNLISSGVDLNGNSILDAAEVSATKYVCNGTGTLTWVHVLSTVYQAVSNQGYLADNASQVVITLPIAPSVGDVVRFNGVGAGGFRIAQNAGQTVLTRNLPGNFAFTAYDQPRQWYSLTTSADGTVVYAGTYSSGVYKSTDSGKTYSPLASAPSTSFYWRSLATSADGTKVFGAGGNNGTLQYSADSGATWTAVGGISGYWSSVSMSSDGTKLFAANSNNGMLYTSTDSGATFTARAQPGYWQSTAMSADGTTLVAVESNNAFIWVSADSGGTFTKSGAQQGSWQGVAMSADGTRIAATDPNNAVLGMSTDSGATWTYNSGWGQNNQSVSMSADGQKILTGDSNNGLLYVSTDFGATFQSHSVSRQWRNFAVSGDGLHMYATGHSSPIYAAANQGDSTALGVGGSITGFAHDALELQYIGGGQFGILSYSSYSGAFSVK